MTTSHRATRSTISTVKFLSLNFCEWNASVIIIFWRYSTCSTHTALNSLIKMSLTLNSFSFWYQMSSSSSIGMYAWSKFRSSRDRDKILRLDTISRGIVEVWCGPRLKVQQKKIEINIFLCKKMYLESLMNSSCRIDDKKINCSNYSIDEHELIG